jgi:uncharacterized protein (TIGR02594 family)
MLRWVLGAVLALPCLLNPAQAEEEKSGAAYSVRSCNGVSGCSYDSGTGAAPAGRTNTKYLARSARTARTQAATPARVTQAAESRANLNAAAAPAAAEPRASVAPAALAGIGGGLGGGSLISEARRYVGMTGAQLGVKHRGAWCGEFLGRVARVAGIKTPGNPNLAPEWREAGQRISGPRVGAIALVNRGRGVGHVGIVTGVSDSGDPIIISGNHNNRVAEVTYPRGRIAAYIWPGG